MDTENMVPQAEISNEAKSRTLQRLQGKLKLEFG